MTRVGIVAGIIIIVIAAVFFGFKKTKKAAEARDAAAAKEIATAKDKSSSTTGAAPGSAKAPREQPEKIIKRIDPESRKLMLEQIRSARAKREAPPGAPPALPSPPQELSKDYIRTQVRAMIPLLTECYTKALEDDPKLAGKMVVKFSIGGEPEIGGLVETSEVDAKESTIKHDGMVECVRETMYGAEFAAPEGGGIVEVHYPFEFTNNP